MEVLGILFAICIILALFVILNRHGLIPSDRDDVIDGLKEEIRKLQVRHTKDRERIGILEATLKRKHLEFEEENERLLKECRRVKADMIKCKRDKDRLSFILSNIESEEE